MTNGKNFAKKLVNFDNRWSFLILSKFFFYTKWVGHLNKKNVLLVLTKKKKSYKKLVIFNVCWSSLIFLTDFKGLWPTPLVIFNSNKKKPPVGSLNETKERLLILLCSFFSLLLSTHVLHFQKLAVKLLQNAPPIFPSDA